MTPLEKYKARVAALLQILDRVRDGQSLTERLQLVADIESTYLRVGHHVRLPNVDR